MNQDKDVRHLPVEECVSQTLGRPARGVIEDGRCVVAPNPNNHQPYCILDSGTLDRVIRNMMVRGD
jgi:hypothetical protein